MWNGSRPGPRGGMPFRGEMFEGKTGPMSGFRGDGMNMGTGPHDRPLMDMRRFDCLPDMGRDRGRDRDFFRPSDEPDNSFQRRFDMGQNVPDRFGPGRSPTGMGDREMQNRNIRGPKDQFMDMRDMDRIRTNFPGLDMDRRRFAMESMDRNDNRRGISQMGMNELDGFNMDIPSRQRPMMDFDRRRCGPPLNPRGLFDADVDFRNQMGSPGNFRDRSPQQFQRDDGNPLNIRGRPDMPPDRQGPEKPMHKVGETTLRDREFPEGLQNTAGFRAEDGKSLSKEWGGCGIQERGSFTPVINQSLSLPRNIPSRFQSGPDKEGDMGEPTQFKDRRPQSTDIPGKVFDKKEPPVKKWDGVPAGFSGRDAPHTIQKVPLLPLDPTLSIPSRGPEGQTWPRDAGKASQGAFKGKDVLLDEGLKKGSLMQGPREPQSNRGGRRDQDYRDSDYRTGSGQKYDYILQNQEPEKNLKQPKPATGEGPNSSGSQDQDYRSAGVKDKISNTIAISDIPKTATMQQILDAFAVRDGVPMQGMKIKDVVPGYSSDTAYVEFLNIEDAVHFMESNQGSVKVGCSTALLKYIQPGGSAKAQHQKDPAFKTPPVTQDGLLPCPNIPKLMSENEDDSIQTPVNPHSQGAWQRSSTLTPEAWQQQVDKQQQDNEERGNQRGCRPLTQHTESVFKESKTMIIKNLLPTTTLEVIMKALDPFVYLEERNVRLVKGKTPGSKCFCFVDMGSHEEVVRLVDLLTIPRPITIEGVKVFAEIAKPLKNQNYRKDQEKPSLLGFPPDSKEQQCFPQASQTAIGASAALQGMCASADLTHAVGSDSVSSANFQSLGSIQDGKYPEAPAIGFSGSETPELSGFLYDATSGFYYDPQTTLYYDPTSRYFYNAQTQKYLYWDSTSKTYVPVEGSSTDVPEPNTLAVIVAEAVPTEEVHLAGATEQKENEEATQRPEKKDKEEKPKSLAAFKIMKDMERWAKIQNRHKDTVRAPSPVLKRGEDKKVSKAADAAFAIFERKGAGGDDLFKKPFAPPKKEEKSSKRPIGSLGMLAADYAAGSDEEEEEKPEKIETPLPVMKSQPQTDEREDRLTDWKKMACLLCRRQFPSKDSLIRHQQLSDLHKQNMEIHVKIKKSKKELEALENQEREMNTGTNNPPEAKRRKQQNELGGNSRDGHKANERPGLGLEKPERKKDSGSWNYATYQQAVRKAMFARFKELD